MIMIMIGNPSSVTTSTAYDGGGGGTVTGVATPQ